MAHSPADDMPVSSSSTASDQRRWFGELSQRDFDVAFYERVLEGQPDNVQILKLLGELYARGSRPDQALRVDERLARLLPRDAVVRYNLACSLAMHGEPLRAIAELRTALELGYSDFGQLEVDPDLETLRGLPQYKTLIAQMGPSA